MEHTAVCHVHSNWSYDGSWTLEALSEKFRRRGCRVLMMTDHDRGFTVERLAEYREACAQVSSDEILVVPGIEYSDGENRVHVLVWGLVPFLGENLSTSEMLEKVQAARGLAVLAHPSRRGVWKTFDPSWADRLLGIEAWNRKYDGWAPSQTAPELLKKTGAVPFVGLDFHTERQSFPLTMVLDIEGTVTEENVLKCLSSRQCHPAVFSLPFDESRIHEAHPVLNLTEKGRKVVARVARSARRLKSSKKS